MIDDKQSSDSDLIGIKGWLLWFSIIVVASPFISLVTFSTNLAGYPTLIENGHAGLAYFEIIGNVAYIVIGALSAFLLIQRRTIAKKFLIYGLLLGNVIFLFLDSYFANNAVTDFVNKGFLTPEEGADLIGDNTQLGRGILAALIWIPYLLLSKRVRATLVNPKASSNSISEEHTI